MWYDKKHNAYYKHLIYTSEELALVQILMVFKSQIVPSITSFEIDSTEYIEKESIGIYNIKL